MFIRKAEVKDIDQILILLGQVLEVHASIRPDIFKEGSTKFNKEELMELIDDENKPIFVATNGDKVLGYLFSEIKANNSHHQLNKKTFYIEDLTVDKDERRKHIGEALFEFAKEEARKRKCDEITLVCWKGNESAFKFYEKLGFKERYSLLEMKL